MNLHCRQKFSFFYEKLKSYSKIEFSDFVEITQEDVLLNTLDFWFYLNSSNKTIFGNLRQSGLVWFSLCMLWWFENDVKSFISMHSQTAAIKLFWNIRVFKAWLFPEKRLKNIQCKTARQFLSNPVNSCQSLSILVNSCQFLSFLVNSCQFLSIIVNSRIRISYSPWDFSQ